MKETWIMCLRSCPEWYWHWHCSVKQGANEINNNTKPEKEMANESDKTNEDNWHNIFVWSNLHCGFLQDHTRLK